MNHLQNVNPLYESELNKFKFRLDQYDANITLKLTLEA